MWVLAPTYGSVQVLGTCYYFYMITPYHRITEGSFCRLLCTCFCNGLCDLPFFSTFQNVSICRWCSSSSYIILILLKAWSKFNPIWISWTTGLSLIILPLTHQSLNTFSSLLRLKPDTFCSTYISNAPLEHALSYSYLGVIISYNSSWFSHVHNLCKKARKLIGFLCRNFYKDSSSSTLLNI